MDSNKRPETMERITTPELAEAFIAEQVAAFAEVKENIKRNIVQQKQNTAYDEKVAELKAKYMEV